MPAQRPAGKPPRVLMAIQQYYPIIGGVERQAQQLAEALVRRGGRVSVLTARSTGTRREEIINGVPVRRVRFLDSLRLGPMKFHLVIAAMAHRMRRQREDYDILHAHEALWPAYAATVAGSRLGKPVIVKLAGTGALFDFDVLRRMTPGGDRMATYMREHIDRIVATSDAIAADLVRFGFDPRRIARIPNGVVIPEGVDQRRRAMRLRLGLREGDVLYIFVGHLEPHKRPRLALEAFRRTREQLPASRLLLLGDGSERTTLVREIEESRLREAVTCLGEVADVADYLAAADVFVLPSDVEGLSNALLEAMAHGLACVATRAGGNVDLIREGDTGLLVPVGDAGAMAEVMVAMGRDADVRRRLGSGARGLVADRYRMDGVVDAYVALYEAVLACRGLGSG